MPMTRTDYDAACTLLGVSPDAPAKEIRTVWRTALLKAHPDQGGDPSAFKALVTAFRDVEAVEFTRPPLPQRYVNTGAGDFGGLTMESGGSPPDFVISIPLSDVINGCFRDFQIPRWLPCPEVSPTHGLCCGGLGWVKGSPDTEVITIQIPPGAGFAVGESPTRLRIPGYGMPLGPKSRAPLAIVARWSREVGPKPVTTSRGTVTSFSLGYPRLPSALVFHVTLDLVEVLLGGPLSVDTLWGKGTVAIPAPDVLLWGEPAHQKIEGLPGIPYVGNPSLPTPPCLITLSVDVGAWESEDQRALLTQLLALRKPLDRVATGYGDEPEEGATAPVEEGS